MRIVFAETVEYTLGARDLLEGVNVELRHGDRMALVGANGSGKTTLLKLLTGDLEPTRGRIHKPAGNYLVLLPQDPEYGAGETVESVLQVGFERLEKLEAELNKLETRLDDPEIYHQWEELHQRFEALGGYSRRSRYEAVVKGLRFEGREQTQAAVLSGGEARRLALGAVLLSGADALLLDEPTNHLDVDMRDWLAGYLNNFGGALVLVSHDRNFLDRVVRKVVWLRSGNLKLYEGNYSSFRIQRKEQEELEARQYANWVKEKERREAILEQARRWAPSSEVHAKRMHSLEARMEHFLQEAPDAPEYDEETVRMRFPQGVAVGDTRKASNLADPGPERVLEGEHLSKSLAGRKLFGIETMLIRRGERIALIGPNGAGKTTMLKVLLGQLSSDNPAGRVKTGYGIHVGYYDQQLSGFDPEVTLYQTLYRLLGEKAHAALGAWKFPYEAQFKQIANLSGGERARLALLSLSLKEANLLVLDEPTNHLDLETVEALEEALLKFPGTLLLVSHDLFFLNQLATRTWHLRQGQFDDYPGPPNEYFERTGNSFASLVPRPMSLSVPEPGARNPEPKPQSTRPKGRWHLERERDRLEALVAELEQKIQTLQARINEPGLGPDDYRTIADEQHRLEAELAQTYSAWEEVVGKLEGQV